MLVDYIRRGKKDKKIFKNNFDSKKSSVCLSQKETKNYDKSSQHINSAHNMHDVYV